MERYICLFILLSVHSSLQQQYAYQQQLVAMPSKPCVGEEVTLRCEILVTIANNTDLVSANIERGGEPITSATVNHMLLRDGVDIVGVIVISVTLDDNGVEYNCSASGAPPSFESSLILNVTVLPTIPNVTVQRPLSDNTSFNVSWTIEADPDYNYILEWTNLRTGMVEDSVAVPENTSSYMVTNLTGMDNYNASVTANNSCGMMMSDPPITVYDKPNAPMNLRMMGNSTSESFLVQWDEVMDIFSIDYTVRWNPASASGEMQATVDKLSYNVTRLVPDTIYTVTVVANSICCGAGPFSNAIMVRTAMGLPKTVSTSSVDTNKPTPTPPEGSGNGNGGSAMGVSDDDDPTVIIIVVCVMVIILIIITTIIILVVYRIKKKKWPCTNKDSKDSDTQELKSPTSTSEGHKMGKSSVQPSSVPHETAASGEEYALTTKVVPRSQQQQQPAQEYAVVDKSKKHSATTQGITYADLQQLPSSGNVPSQNQGPTSTYAMVA